ncbi:MAG TPA: glycosyltransferase family 1 protein [Ktedonobacterales bacterium]|nr:glycosyltransferase family 1 protein [Ktedonobacterales bacterium]
MRITIDYTAAITQGAGIGRYTRSIVSALARVDDADHFTLFSTERPTAARGFPDVPHMRPRVFPAGNRNMTIFWQRLRAPVPVELFAGRADLFHGPDFILPPLLGTPAVVTIHDLAFLTNPECALPSLVRYLSAAVPRALRRASAVVSDSEKTANDLHTLLGVPREKITVIYCGVDPLFTPQAEPAAVAALRAKYGFTAPTVLAVGTIEPRKNYERLIAAFAQARSHADGPRTLVIAGRPGWLYDGVFAAVEKHGLRDSVRFLDFIPDSELTTLYHAADVLAMPSIYEGFGIPVLEAMASGTPVVCSDGGSLPEVAGDAALVVPVEDVDGLAGALVRAASDEELRGTLVARGLARVKRFTWEGAARELVLVYHETAKGKQA